MGYIRDFIRRGRHSFATDSLFRNSVFLIASTAIMAVLGFGFWLFVAHLYSPADIGSASALIAVTTLLGNISLLGLEASLVRFLPGSKHQSRDINAALVVVSLAAVVAAVVYLVIGPDIGVHINLLDSPWEKVGFVVLMVVVGLNSLTDSIFIANRRAELHTMTYGTLALVKLILPLFLVPFGSMGIFAAYAFAMLAALILTFFLMRFANTDRYHALVPPDWSLLGKAKRYAIHNYIGHILSSLGSQIMPVLILARLGADQAAFFAMAWTMANFLYVVPTAIAQSLLAEGATSPADRKNHTRHATRILILVLVPMVAVAIVTAPFLLSIFGQEYSIGSSLTFQILALATFFVAINEVCNTILNIERRSAGVVVAQLSSLVVTLGSAVFLLRFGLAGVGFALLLGNIASNLSHVIFFGFRIGVRPQPKAEPQPVSQNRVHDLFQKLLSPYGISTFHVTRLAHGSGARTFRIMLSDHQSYVLRVYKAGHSQQFIQQEIDFMMFLARKGVPVPHIIPNQHGHTISHTQSGPTTYYYILMPFETGSHPSQYTPGLIQSMARAQAAIHIYGAEFARHHSHRPGRTKTDWLLSLAPKGLSHCDYDASNILAEGHTITCILDFEGMRFVPLVSCLFFTLSRIYDAEHNIESLRNYLYSYRQVRRLNRIERFIIRSALAGRYRRPQLFFAV